LGRGAALAFEGGQARFNLRAGLEAIPNTGPLQAAGRARGARSLPTAPHHTVGDTVGLLLITIVCRSHQELGLDQALDRPVAIARLQGLDGARRGLARVGHGTL